MLRLPSPFPFVGRTAELATLRALLPRAAGEGHRVALVGGEPGCGKSRLVRELAGGLADGEATVLYGSCDAVVNTPYQPFVEALDHLLRQSDPAELEADLGTGAGELARLLPDLRLRLGEAPPPVSADADTERHRLHLAVTNLLAASGRRRPVLLVLEDAHWADVPTLHLLRHLVRAGADARVLLVATFRDGDAGVRPELAEALADLARAEGVSRLRLAGLGRAEVTEFVRRASGSASGDEVVALAETISDLTKGNPFLLCELWRALVETGTLVVGEGGLRLVRPVAELATPETVREVVSSRLARLSPATRELLELAAIVGPEFELEVLGAAAGLESPVLRAALEEAVGSAMIEEVPSLGLAFRFAHELVRRALVDALSALRRAELHLRVAEALERVHAGDPGRALAELAHHFTAAAPVGGSARAVEYGVLAARAALGALAHEEAAGRFETALALGIEDGAERAGVELELGTALNRAGKTLEALERYRVAAAIARGLDEPELLARAAIGLEEACWRPGIVDQGADRLLREALGALRGGDEALRVRLLAGLARALVLRGEHREAAAAHAEALELARLLGDRPTLATVLIGSYWARGEASEHDVLDMLAEARALGEELGDMTIRGEAIAWTVVTQVALGELEVARSELELLRAAAERSRQPFIHYAAWMFGSSLALCDGRLAEAEELAERSYEWGRLLQGPDASGAYGIQLFDVRREQGRLAELAPVVRLLADVKRSARAWRPGLVALLAELGMEEEARRELRAAVEAGEAGRDALGLAGLVYLADAAVALGERATCALLYRDLSPLEGRSVLVGHLVACFGSADRYLGKLAAATEAWADAERHFERALELNERMRATLWLAHARADYAAMLLARGAEGDRRRAAELAASAARFAESTGARGLAERIAGLGPSAPSAAALPDGLSPREVAVLRLVALGLSNREIGERLVISEHTAANHVRSILRKTGCANRTEATAYGYRHGLVGG